MRRVVRSQFQSVLWDTAVGEAAVGLDRHRGGGTNWGNARITIRRIHSRPMGVDDTIRCLTLAIRCSRQSPAWLLNQIRDSANKSAVGLTHPSDVDLSELCHALLADCERQAISDIVDAAEDKLGEWQGPDGDWWLSNGAGRFKRAASMMTAHKDELLEHYFHVKA